MIPSLILAIYASLNNDSSSNPLTYVAQWERDLANTIDLVDWRRAWSSAAKCSFNTAILEAAYKVLLHWYWVSAGIAHANFTVTIVSRVVAIGVTLYIPGGNALD